MDRARAVELYLQWRDVQDELEPKPAVAKYTSFLDDAAIWLSVNDFAINAKQQLQDMANFVNEFAFNYQKLRAWERILPALSDQERLDVLIEFVDPIVYLCVGAPAALKGRFHYSIEATSHLANEHRVTGWTYSPPPTHSSFAAARSQAELWESWPNLRDCLGVLNNREFKKHVDEFRDHFHHGNPRLVEFGEKLMAWRDVHGRVVGVEPAISLATLVKALAPQQSASVAAYDAYVALVAEQHSSMMANNPVQPDSLRLPLTG